jgi:two-component system phosphate regulon sensor histidine kinase PhoR
LNKSPNKYSFALITSLYVAILISAVFAALLYTEDRLHYNLLLICFLVVWAICFAIIQFRTKVFILKEIKNIYDEVNLVESSTLSRNYITTDLNDLKRQVVQFTRDKKIEIEALEIRENYRKEFMGNVSHELKTPLFTVQSYILTLLDGAMKDKTVRDKYLINASKGVERLIIIVKDLDMISKLEVGDLNLDKKSFDIIALLSSIFDLFEMRAQRRGITLTLDRDYKTPIMVIADRERIQQVLTNLIINSIKYGKQNGTTEVSVEDLIHNKVIVRVTDNGEGISKENIPRLFERFFRVDKSGSRKEGGSGLGLAIVKHIIEAHQEKIYVESELGVGSEFSFTLEKSK